MTATGQACADLAAALLEVVAASDGVLVASPQDERAAATRAAAPERFVPVVADGARAAVAAGIALAGRPAVFLTAADVPSHLPRLGGLVAVVEAVQVAGACWGAGWTLAQPAWRDDTAPLLAAALAATHPVVLRPPRHGGLAPEARVAPGAEGAAPPARLGLPRVLRDGRAGLLAASGEARVGLLVTVARMLAGRGVDVQALDLPTSAPGEGPGPSRSEEALYVGHRCVAVEGLAGGRWPAGLEEVRVPDDARAAMDAVTARLRARR